MTLETDSLEVDRGRSPLFIFIAIILAFGLTLSLFFGYMYLRRRHAERILAAQQEAQKNNTKPVVPAKIQVFEDEAMIKGGNAVVGGTLQNISKETLRNLTVEIELTRRNDGSKEKRTLAVEPKDLAPDEKGRYSLTILSRDYKQAHMIGVRAGTDSSEVAFTSAPGARRPPEKNQPKTIIINQPPPRKDKGEEFLNTPDKPVTVK